MIKFVFDHHILFNFKNVHPNAFHEEIFLLERIGWEAIVSETEPFESHLILEEEYEENGLSDRVLLLFCDIWWDNVLERL